MSNSFPYARERRTMHKLRFSIHLTSTETYPFYNVYKLIINKYEINLMTYTCRKLYLYVLILYINIQNFDDFTIL